MIDKNNCVQCEIQNQKFYLCTDPSEEDEQPTQYKVRLVTPGWTELMSYTAVLIHKLIKSGVYAPEEIQLTVTSLSDSVNGLVGVSNGDSVEPRFDVHTGLYAPLQSEYYCDYMGHKISFTKPFYNNATSKVVSYEGNTVTVDDLANNNFNLYVSSTDAGDYQTFMRYLDNNNIPRDNFNVEVRANEQDLYDAIVADTESGIGLVWEPHPLFSDANNQLQDVQGLEDGDIFPVSSLIPAVNNDFKNSVKYSSTLRRFLRGFEMKTQAFIIIGNELLNDGINTSDYTPQMLYDLIERLDGEHKKHIQLH